MRQEGPHPAWPIFLCLLVTTASCWRWGGTTYAPRFDESAFRKIHLGMNAVDVKALVGDPLAVEQQDFKDEWIYRKSQDAHRGELGILSSEELRVPAASHISFDRAGRVDTQYGDYMRPIPRGTTKQEVLSALGPPAQTNASCAGQVYVYSKPASGGDYEVRKVVLGTNGCVVELVSFTYRD